MFTPEEIQARVRRQPFVPLRIVTSAGQTFDIPHPELIMIGRRSVEVGSPSPENPTTFERVTHVAIMHINTIEELPVPAAPGGNGQQ
jgi:hypothetical protein